MLLEVLSQDIFLSIIGALCVFSAKERFQVIQRPCLAYYMLEVVDQSETKSIHILYTISNQL